jgi:hypothetical protein
LKRDDNFSCEKCFNDFRENASLLNGVQLASRQGGTSEIQPEADDRGNLSSLGAYIRKRRQKVGKNKKCRSMDFRRSTGNAELIRKALPRQVTKVVK